MLLDGKVALVTGAASGIGQATGLAMARAGASVVLGDVNTEGVRQTAELIAAEGGRARYAQMDISILGQVQAAVALAVSEFGRIDCAANVAAIQGPVGQSMADIPADAFAKTLEVNVLGTWNCLKAEVDAMLQSGGGAIVNVASCAGIRGFAFLGAYTTSKHAIVGLTRAAALDYARKNIRVNAICPGFTLTAMIAESGARANIEAAAAANPSGRVAKPEEQANAIVYLCSDQASFITGQALAVDGGQTTQPAQPPRKD
jgi:NAD(P)-dependent dehydrogenase (short-subunit alcohol dehydrogenase family)